jgi:hypothetical protein
MSSAITVGRERPSRGQVRARADNDVPEHLRCSVCLDAPCGRIEQCANGEHISHVGTRPLVPRTRFLPTTAHLMRFRNACISFARVRSPLPRCVASGSRRVRPLHVLLPRYLQASEFSKIQVIGFA